MPHRRRRDDLDIYLFLPRIIAANPQLQRLVAHRYGDLVAHVEVNKKRIRANGIDVMPQRRQHAGDIRRATGTAEPALADGFHMIVDMVERQGFRMDLQRVHIEEVLTVQSHAPKHRVV